MFKVNIISSYFLIRLIDDIITIQTSDRMVKKLKDLFSDIFYSDPDMETLLKYLLLIMC